MSDYLNSITKSIQAVKEVYSNLSKPFEDFANAQQAVIDVVSKQSEVASYIFDIQNRMNQAIPKFNNFNVLEETINSITEAFNIDYSGLAEQINILDEIDAIVNAESLSQAVDNVYRDIREDDEITGDSFTEEELTAALEEQLSNPKGWQERFFDWAEEKRKKFFIAFLIIKFICDYFVQPYFSENIGKPVMSHIVSKVKESPQNDAEIIGELGVGEEAIISADTNYYYKITFTDENGDSKEGYVAKRNVKVIENEIEDERKTDEN